MTSALATATLVLVGSAALNASKESHASSSTRSDPVVSASAPRVARTPTNRPTARTSFSSSPSATRQPRWRASAVPRTAAAILTVTDQKDGDSWVASDGNEYRLGLVNAPEYNEPCGSEATAFTRSFLSGGFTAHAYATDVYGRRVSEIFDLRGHSLNIALAASGLGNDKYLSQFRHENPQLASRLDHAFSTAPTPRCLKASAQVSSRRAAATPSTSPPSAARSPASTCHPDYITCIPIQGNGSGSGDANDLDCGSMRTPVRLRNTNDPYHLDADHNGWGCESYR